MTLEAVTDQSHSGERLRMVVTTSQALLDPEKDIRDRKKWCYVHNTATAVHDISHEAFRNDEITVQLKQYLRRHASVMAITKS